MKSSQFNPQHPSLRFHPAVTTLLVVVVEVVVVDSEGEEAVEEVEEKVPLLLLLPNQKEKLWIFRMIPLFLL